MDGLFSNSRAATAHEPWGAPLMRAMRRHLASAKLRQRIRRDIHRLRSLDDRMLADVGLHRAEIEPAVRHGRRPRDIERAR